MSGCATRREICLRRTTCRVCGGSLTSSTLCRSSHLRWGPLAMSDDIPHAQLSERVTDCIDGRKVVSALFLTYKLDPAFFELEVLPLLFGGASFSHATAIRAVQLDELLRTIGEVAVYYDAG